MRSLRSVGLAFLLLSCIDLSRACAEITPSGDVSPANPAGWNSSTYAYIGVNSAGTLTVNGGSTITTSAAEFGGLPGVFGSAEISGSGSKWNTDALLIGYSGLGSLSILNGGNVTTSSSVYLGCYNGSSGTITVSGTDSTLTVPNRLFVGYNPRTRGTVTQNDGLVSVGRLDIAYGETSVGTYNLNGGTLAVNSLVRGSGTATFNFNGGTLRADADFTTYLDATLSGTDTINTQNHNVVWNGNLSGAGELVKAGSGTLTLNGAHTYTGGTYVEEGTLATGNGYSSSSTSRLRTKIDPSGSCGVLAVTGTASVDGTLGVTGASGTFTAGTNYTFLTATGGVSGTFKNVVDDLAFFDVVLTYEPYDIYFTLVAASNYVDEARTFNQYGVASYLDAHKGGATGDFLAVLDALNTLDGAGARGAFGAMSGEIYGSLATIAIENNERLLRMIANRMRMESMFRNADFSTVSAPRRDSIVYVSREVTDFDAFKNRLSGWTTWLDSYGVGASVAGNGNASGLGYSTGGVAVGMERYLDDRTLVGFGGGYVSSRTVLDARSDWGSIDGGQCTAYMRRDNGNDYLTGIFAYGYNGYASRRHINFAAIDRIATADYGGNNYSTYVEVGRNIFGRYANWQPFAAMEYIGVRQNAFTEQDANSIDLQVRGLSANAFRGLLGTRVLDYCRTSSGRILTLDVSAAWRHEFLGNDPIFDASFAGQTGGAFAVSGINVDRDAAIIGTGLNYALSDNCSIYASYDLLFSKHYTAHAGLGGFQYAW